MPREIENPKTGVHLQPSKGARAQGKRCPVLHGAKLPVDDDPAESFGRPDKLFEAGAANRVVDHFGTKSLGAFENRFLDILPAGDDTWSAPTASRPSCLASERVTAMLLARMALIN